MQEFDLVVIGGGPAGYVASIKAAQLGLKVVCIEKEKTLGGTCLNIGCIPSKALLDSSEKYYEMKHKGAEHGLDFSDLKLNLARMMSRKNKLVQDLNKGIEGLFKKNGVTHIIDCAQIKGSGLVEIVRSGEQIKCNNIVIASGSKVMNLPGIEIDEKYIISSTGALELNSVPKKMIIIGAGYIGLELGSVWMRLGAEVEVIEHSDRLVPMMDHEIGNHLHNILAKSGIKFRFNASVKTAKRVGDHVDVEIEDRVNNKSETLNSDVLLVAVGRKPNTDDLDIEKMGIALDDRNRIKVNNQYETNIKNIYAIGDVIEGPMLAHKAEEEGIAVAEIIAGKKVGRINYDIMPSVVYTWPEVASVGKTEEQVKQDNIEYKVGKFPFLANGRAKAAGDVEGIVKIITSKKTDRILGAHIIGPNAGTLIAELVLAIEYSASSEDIALTIHAHPTLNEAVKEAALSAFSKPIHF